MRRTNVSVFFVSSLLLLLLLGVAQASITIVDSGKTLASKPDRKLGERLWKGYEYIGRLQYVQGNMQLCRPLDPRSKFRITVPSDGLPVALFAKTGGCSLEEKAVVASTMIDPPGIVSYLIVDDDGRRKKGKYNMLFGGGEEDDEATNPFWAETERTTDDEIALWDSVQAAVEIDEVMRNNNNDNNGIIITTTMEEEPLPYDDEPVTIVLDHEQHEDDDDDSTDDEPAPVQFIGKASVKDRDDDDDSTDDEPAPLQFIGKASEDVNDDEEDSYDMPSGASRVLRRHKSKPNENIDVALLHVHYKAGYELFNLVLQESAQTRHMGGSKILVNGKEPAASFSTMFLWTLLSISLCCCACCGLALFVNHGFLEGEEQTPPPRPVRRRLTHQQVRDNYPAFHYHPESHVENPLEECAICLDEYEPGIRCRQLPCQHVFHSTCIGRWLIERSATCPLCKTDLYEEVEEEEEDSDSTAEASTPITQTHTQLLRWWSELTSRSSSQHDPVATPNDGTPLLVTANPQLPPPQPNWWRRRQAQIAMVAPNANANATGSPPPARSSWWSLSSSHRTTGDDTEDAESQGGWRPNWFGRVRRRPTMGGMTMTELTEPLMTGDRGEEPSSEETTTTTTTLVEQEEIPTRTPTVMQGSSQEEPQSTTTQVEV